MTARHASIPSPHWKKSRGFFTFAHWRWLNPGIGMSLRFGAGKGGLAVKKFRLVRRGPTGRRRHRLWVLLLNTYGKLKSYFRRLLVTFYHLWAT